MKLIFVVLIASCATASFQSSWSWQLHSNQNNNGYGQGGYQKAPITSDYKAPITTGYKVSYATDYKAPVSGGYQKPPSSTGYVKGPVITNYGYSKHPGLIYGHECPVEHKTLDELYADALAEGGRVIVYAGGDTPGQQDNFKNEFEMRFPNITMDVIVDYSKNHNARIDIQVANLSLVPDVVQLQTLQDFPRWKHQGLLLCYKTRNFDHIYYEFKDPDGYYTGVYVVAFTNCINKYLLADRDKWPLEARDYLHPDLAEMVTLTYPNDDDAVLFVYKLIVDKYGWDYIQKLSMQNFTLVRGTQEPLDALSENRTAAAPATACSMTNPSDSPIVFVLPKRDPFVTWPQTAAIFKDAKNPATAKLYLNWITEKETQEKVWEQWSVRKDVAPPKGYRSLWEYPGQTDPTAFGHWMADRGAVERFRQQLQQFMGEVMGDPSPGALGVYPDKALPH